MRSTRTSITRAAACSARQRTSTRQHLAAIRTTRSPTLSQITRRAVLRGTAGLAGVAALGGLASCSRTSGSLVGAGVVGPGADAEAWEVLGPGGDHAPA